MATDRMAHNPSAPIVRCMIAVPDHHSTEPNGVSFETLTSGILEWFELLGRIRNPAFAATGAGLPRRGGHIDANPIIGVPGSVVPAGGHRRQARDDQFGDEASSPPATGSVKAS